MSLVNFINFALTFILIICAILFIYIMGYYEGRLSVHKEDLEVFRKRLKKLEEDG